MVMAASPLIPPARATVVAWGEMLVVAILIVIIVAARLHGYPLFHALAELFSIVVGLTAFSMAWNTRRTLDSTFLMVVGLAFGPVSATDLIHTLTYKGMGVFTNADANLPTQLWIAGRMLAVAAIATAAVAGERRLRPSTVLSAFVSAGALLLASIFWWGGFPDCWREGSGLTAFKIGAEYVFMALMALSLARLWRLRQQFATGLFRYVAASIVMMIVMEACFTLYTDVYGALNMAGHVAKIIAFYLVYAGVVHFGFTKPQETLFGRLSDDVLRSNERASLAVAAAHGAVWEWDMHTPDIVLTPQHAEWLGVAAPPSFDALSRCLSEADRHALERAIAPRTDNDVRTEEFCIDVPGRSPRWVRTLTRVVARENTRTPVMIGFDMDITKAKTAALDRERLLDALQRSHSEMRRFAEILAHHLQEPVQRQLRYTQKLDHDLANAISPASRELLHFIVDGGQRLRELLRAVQLYLAIGNLPPPAELCPAQLGLDDACRRLSDRIREVGAVVETQVLPEVSITRERLTDLFSILLDNALEYRAPDRPPRIRVNGASAKDGVEISVSDNGIGIESQYAEKIFGVFERLHTRQEHPGTGIGLALARKIVEGAGGTIKVESRLGEGSTFHIRIPTETRR